MKANETLDLIEVNKALSRKADSNYRLILRSVVASVVLEHPEYGELGHAISSWNVPAILGFADSLVAQVHATATKHYVANQVAALIRKYPFTSRDSGIDAEQVAIDTFKLSERRCRRVNRWFLARRRRRGKTLPITGTLFRASRWIEYVLGALPDLRRVYDRCDITGGACLGVHGDATNLARKLLAGHWTVGSCARQYFVAALNANFHYAARIAPRNEAGIQSLQVSDIDLNSCCKVTDYNKVGFVPKTAKTHRSIAVEPLGNSYLQKGIDLVMREQLRRVGLDLRWQAPNQEMARKGSFDEPDGFVTIDLSSASDSVSLELCREVLPPDWFTLLNCVRSPSYTLDEANKQHRYEKFVSMGNGFCFPLQTLLFASLVKSIEPSARPGVDFRVYGDDIIVRKNICGELISLLSRLGFKTNSRKTFVSGPFRESCGSNWYAGEDVTPMTLDYKLDTVQSMFKFLNLSRRNARCSAFFEEARQIVLACFPDRFHFVRPFKGRPDTGIDPMGVELAHKWQRNKFLQCYKWKELHTTPVQDRVVLEPRDSWVYMAAALRGNSSTQPFTLRRKTKTRIRIVSRGCPEPQDETGNGDPDGERREAPPARLALLLRVGVMDPEAALQ